MEGTTQYTTLTNGSVPQPPTLFCRNVNIRKCLNARPFVTLD